MLALNKNPTRKELRLFACLWFMLAGSVMGTLMYLRHEHRFAFAVWISSALMFIAGIVAPKLVKPVFLGLTYLTYPLGYCLSYVVLVLIFILVMLPISVLMRLFKFDPLNRKFDRQSHTYWTKRKEEKDFKQHFRQF